MGTLNIVDWAKLLGFVLVVIATIISTVKMPAMDKEISRLTGEVLRFKDSRIMASVCMLHYGEQFTRRRIELFEANQILATGKDKGSVNKLRKRALEQTIQLAHEWASLFGGDEADSREEQTKEQISKIIDDQNISVENKLIMVEKIWKENRNAASDRLAKAHEKYHENNATKENLEGARLFWAKGFACLQIFGLILFSGAEIIGKLIYS